MTIPSALDQLAERLKNEIPSQFFAPLPVEVTNYWLDGKYTGSLEPSVGYEQLGWALMIRGLYEYKVTKKTGGTTTTTHRGYCIIDLCRGEIHCYGIRMRSEAPWDQLRAAKHPLLWKSEVCAIRPAPTERKAARLICAYRLLGKKECDSMKKVHEAFKALWAAATEDDKKDKDNPYMGGQIAADGEMPLAIGYLVRQFDNDWKIVKGEITPPSSEVMSAGFNVNIAGVKPTETLTISGDYRSYTSPPVDGVLEFTRIDHTVL